MILFPFWNDRLLSPLIRSHGYPRRITGAQIEPIVPWFGGSDIDAASVAQRRKAPPFAAVGGRPKIAIPGDRERTQNVPTNPLRRNSHFEF